MSDSDGPKAKVIPSWQRLNVPKPAERHPEQDADEPTAPEDRASLIEKAAKFLENEDIRDAPRERKEYFLTLKGLTEDEIRDLLEEQHVPEADIVEGFEKEQQEVSQPTPSPALSAPIENPSPAPLKDVPPIITYPEFLLHSQRPPPLITVQRLLNTFYFATGAAATLYGTSKYIIEPMVESLTSARHSLFETASADLDKLNKTLEKTVSKIPEVSHNDVDDSDAESTNSDGARFFNRSAATQTSPSLSRSTSGSSESSKSDPSVASAHWSRLSKLHSKLSELLPEKEQAAEPSIDSAATANPLKDRVDDLRRYLDGLASASISSSGKKPGEMDEIAKVKAEIRGVKGVLLSARNFPSSVVPPVR